MELGSGAGFRVRRVYDPPEPVDFQRVLVDRLWPRGLSKERARLDEWLKVVAPSNGLRVALHSGELDFAGFEGAYEAELDEPERAEAVGHLLDLADRDVVTLVTAAKEPERSHVSVLLAHLGRERARRAGR
ncbi:DUF488 domain-containing protein [Streptomyces sp. NPDC002580]|uniref:DUF488 domain-containing protein n=1 Tax=Streptomyces sp. NPDC002580 TaxID=3364653 RepID=UPI0036AD1AB9